MASRIEHLGQPCRAKQVLAGRVVREKTGREWFVLTNMNETSGAELLFIDFRRNTGKAYRAPAGTGSWALLEVPGDRLIVGTFYDGKFMVFDLKKKAFIKVADFPGEQYIWNLAIGSDGRVYGGTYPGGKLGALDLNTYSVEDCGAPAPPNLYLRHVSATPDGRILCDFGMEKPINLLYDPASKQFAPLPKPLEGVSRGVSWNGYFLAGSQAWKGGSLEVVEPPFPTPPAAKGGWAVDVVLTTDETLFLRQGNAVYRYAKGDKELSLVVDVDLRGGGLYAATSRGEVLGVRGQDYFVLKPGDQEVRLRPIPVESAARPLHFLKADERGRIWGGPPFGQTLCWLDTRTKKATNTRTVCDSGGEVYDVTFLNGKVYAASYAGGDLIEYDPERPWDQWNHKNPRTIASVGPRGYIRPTGGIVVGADGRLYSGWMAKYGVYGGAVAITEPATGKTDLLENPLAQQAIEGLAVDERFIYLGTSLGANGLPNKKGEPVKFGMIEIATGKIVFEQAFEGASSVRAIIFDPAAKRVAMVVNGALRVFDPVQKQFLSGFLRRTNLPRVTSRSIASGGGKVYYGSEKSLIVVNLENGIVEPMADLPATITNVTVDKAGALYVSCEADVYAVR